MPLLIPRSNGRRRESPGCPPLRPATAAASVATSTLVPAVALANVVSSLMFHATSPGDDRTSWQPERTCVPPLPPPVLNELRRAFHAAREEEGLNLMTQEYTRRPTGGPTETRLYDVTLCRCRPYGYWGSCHGISAHGVLDTCPNGYQSGDTTACIQFHEPALSWDEAAGGAR
eukprot:2094822-Pleurochrysis_carterae.AAC.1